MSGSEERQQHGKLHSTPQHHQIPSFSPHPQFQTIANPISCNNPGVPIPLNSSSSIAGNPGIKYSKSQQLQNFWLQTQPHLHLQPELQSRGAAMAQAIASSTTAVAPVGLCAQAAAVASASNQLSSSFLPPSGFRLKVRVRKGVAKQQGQSFSQVRAVDGFLGMLGLGSRGASPPAYDPAEVAIAQGPDDDAPARGCEFACFGAGCFWGVELAYQRVPGVVKTEVGYTQGQLHNPDYEDVCSGNTGHNEVVRVHYNPAEVSYESLLDVFWDRHDPTTLNRQGGDVGTQYRSGIYFYSPEQERVAMESIAKQQKSRNRKVVTEVIPAKKFYRAESYHQQYLAKGGRMGFKQSAEKGCKDNIRCYG